MTPPQSTSRLALCLPVFFLASIAGCHALESGDPITSSSLLQAGRASDQSVTVDIYWARMGEGLDQGLWTEVQEERLPVELRRRLAKNGLRAGIVGEAMPDVLLKLLDPKEKADLGSGITASLEETGVRRRTRQMRAGKPIELQASEKLAEANLLFPGDGEIRGKTFHDAQGIYLLHAERVEDNRVRIQLRPEVRHGREQLRFAPDETGMISRGKMTRDAELLHDLAIDAQLGAGESLLVTCLPGVGSRLGGLFHTSASKPGERKAILIRIASTPSSRAFE